MDLVTPQIGLMFWTLVTFTLLLVLLKAFAWKPILAALKEREESIDQALKSAEKAREDVSNIKSENEKILQEAKEERAKIIKEANEIKESIITESKGKAKIEANKILKQAKAEIENQKMAAIVEVKNHVANLALNISEKILKQKLDSQKEQEKYIGELLEEMK